MAIPIRVRKIMPIGGLHTAAPEDSIEDSKTPRCLNVHFRFGEIVPRPGSRLFSDKQTAEEVRYIGEFFTSTNIVWLAMLTQTKLYRFGNTVPGNPRDWFAVAGGPAIVTNRRWSTTAGEGRFFFTNDNDVLQWDGVAANPYGDITDADTSGIFPSEKVDARYIEYFNDRLILGYVNEVSGVKSTRIRWPKNGDHTRWNDTTGQGAGFMELFEEGEEAITGLRSLQDRLVVYKRRSIVEVVPTGQLAPVHVSQVRVRGIGCAAPYTLGSNGFAHFFVGNDSNVYMWDSQRIVPIGDPILDELESILDSGKFETAFGQVLPSRQEYWLTPNGTDVFVYDYVRGTWTRDSFPSLAAIGEASDTVGALTWGIAPGTWATAGGTWESQSGTNMVKIFGGRSTGEVFQVDNTIGYDYFAIGSIVDRYVETPDFYFPDVDVASPWVQGTIQRMLITYEFVNSQPFEVGISMDRGSTWLTQAITPTTAGYSVVDFNITGNVVRFRFRENNDVGSFRWRNYAYEFVDAGPYRG